jgi:DNA repair exonuclease SbcCD ATPase subunit
VLRFFVDSQEQDITDNAQGDSRETQDNIEQLLELSHDMFRHILALNTYTEPFLSLKANEQRTIIEQLLGITQLSDRADRIKELNKQTRDAIQQEEFRIRAEQEANRRIQEQIEALKRRQTLWMTKHGEDIQELENALKSLQNIQIEVEIQAHADHKEWDQKRKDINELSTQISRVKMDISREEKQAAKLSKEIETLANHECHTCGQAFHNSKHQQVLEGKQAELSTAQESRTEYINLLSQLEATHTALGTLGRPPKMFYDRESDAIQHQATVTSLEQQIAIKHTETDPYAEQITEMQQQALKEVTYDALNELTRLQEHQDFLLKLLTSKDSFVRKKIIDQNLSYLNARLTHYLDRMGLPHTVVFQNDLTVSIEELGRELDFDNLSRGERNRLILSMSWAFRDVFESLYRPINIMFIDEMIDSGLDTAGVENALGLLKHLSRERNKSVWLVSHRDELTSRVENILKVVKENGFTIYNTNADSV